MREDAVRSHVHVCSDRLGAECGKSGTGTEILNDPDNSRLSDAESHLFPLRQPPGICPGRSVSFSDRFNRKCEQLLRFCDPFEGVAANRHKHATLEPLYERACENVIRPQQFRGAYTPCRDVDRLADDREIETLARSDIAVQGPTEMSAQGVAKRWFAR